MKLGSTFKLPAADPVAPSSGWLVMVALSLYLMGSSIAVMLYQESGAGKVPGPAESVRLQLLVWLVVCLPLVVVALRNKPQAVMLGFKPGQMGLLKGFVASLGLLLVGVVLWAVISQGWFLLLSWGEVTVEPQAHYEFVAEGIIAGRPDLLLIALMVFIHPFFEELLFRGLIQGYARGIMPRWPAVAVTAFFFGMIHGSLTFLIPLILVGLIFGYIRERCGSLWCAWFSHAFFNGAMIALSPWMIGVYETY